MFPFLYEVVKTEKAQPFRKACALCPFGIIHQFCYNGNMKDYPTTIVVDKLVPDGDYFVVESEVMTEEQYLEMRAELNRAFYRYEFTKRFMIGEAFC